MAVFTKLNQKDFENILTSYDLGSFVDFTGISEGVENTNYILQTTSGRFIFTIYEKRVNSEDLPFFMGLLEKLSGKGFLCPKPIRNKTGEVIGKWEAPSPGGGLGVRADVETSANQNIINRQPLTINQKNYTIVSLLPGKWQKTLGVNEVEKSGDVLAKFHNLTTEIKTLSRPNSMGINFWKETYNKVKDLAKTEFPELDNFVSEAFSRIDKNWPTTLPSGIIHADYFPDNVLFENGKVSGVIDFYMACNDIYAYDLAIAINSWVFEKDNSFNITKTSRMLNAYNSARELEPQELEALPILFIGASLRFLSTRLYDYFNRDKDAIVTPKDPREYIEKLKFHLQVKSYREYGI